MPITNINLSPNLTKSLNTDYWIVQYPFGIEAKSFASIYVFRKIKIRQIIATVINFSTTLTSFSIVLPSETIKVEIIAGNNNSNIWRGEKIIEKGQNIIFKINTDGTGSFLTMIIEIEYLD